MADLSLTLTINMVKNNCKIGMANLNRAITLLTEEGYKTVQLEFLHSCVEDGKCVMEFWRKADLPKAVIEEDGRVLHLQMMDIQSAKMGGIIEADGWAFFRIDLLMENGDITSINVPAQQVVGLTAWKDENPTDESEGIYVPTVHAAIPFEGDDEKYLDYIAADKVDRSLNTGTAGVKPLLH